MSRIICFGPGPRFKGGMSQYNSSLARTFAQQGHEVHIVSWSQQYPAIVPRDFIDRASRKGHLEGTQIPIHYLTNYNNPFSWWRTVRFIAGLKPDKIVIQWSIALQGLPLGWMIRWLRRHTQIEVIVDVHFVVQKEGSKIDHIFSRYGLSQAQTYIVHARKTAEELQQLFPQMELQLTETGERTQWPKRTVLKLYHPIYDIYQPDPAFDAAAVKAELGLKQHVFLFFGFIRKYKGLHHALRAFAPLARERDDVSLLVVGESFWQTLDETRWTTRLKKALFRIARRNLNAQAEDETQYKPLELIAELGLQDRVVVVNRYVPNEEVPRYFQVSDCLLLFYEYATPSGVESMAYNFRLPVLVTRVGHFPETVQSGLNGYLAEPEDVNSMTDTLKRFLAEPIAREGVDQMAQNLSWANYVRVILNQS